MSEHLLHPELFNTIPFTGGRVADITERAAQEVAADETPESNISVVIRTLNEAGPLEALLQDIQRNRFAKEVEVIVVDNESRDGTPGVAREYGTELVSLPRDKFTHPYSANLGIEAASHSAVFLTVGHALLSNDQTLRAASHLATQPNFGGAYGITLPGQNISRTERLVAIGTPGIMNKAEVTRASLGVLGATNALISKQAWAELGRFREEYERGGDDTLMAGQMLEAGMRIVRDPALGVHHTHGLGPVNYARQVRQWMQTLRKPQKFDAEQWAKRRPDLDFQ